MSILEEIKDLACICLAILGFIIVVALTMIAVCSPLILIVWMLN